MFEKCTPAQRNGLSLGIKLRYIGAVQGLIRSGYGARDQIEAFTQEESNAIRTICENAHRRARQTFEDEKRKLETTDPHIGASPESRQYTGK